MIFDSHAHCGIQERFPPQGFKDYHAAVAGSDIGGVAMFAPVMEIYDRYDPDFQDNDYWRRRRKRANRYLLNIENRELTVFPYFFIWNDFAVDQLDNRHRGIKWHRHAGEPAYNYDTAACGMALDEIRRRNLPVVLEEEFHHTLRFITELGRGIRVIIPHLGFLNGGYAALVESGIWSIPSVYTDTSLAPSAEIMDYIDRYGADRIFFGSDFPFGDPVSECRKIGRLSLSEEIKAKILGKNLMTLLNTADPAMR